MNERDWDRPVYNIGAAAELVETHPQTLRLYERSGLVEPQRSAGNTRLYSERDLLCIRRIQSYTRMGVNLAGIGIIFRLLARIEELEARLAALESAAAARAEAAEVEALRTRLRREGG